MCAIEISPAIGTARLRLRRPLREDAARIATLADDIEVARMTTRMPHPYARSDAEDFLRKVEAMDPAREAVFAIEHPQDGLIGMLGFHPSDHERPEMGYWLGRPYWGRGYATEAAEAALAWANQGWRKRLVIAGHFADNPASGQVLCKTGFLYTGEVQLRPSIARGQEAVTRMMVWLA